MRGTRSADADAKVDDATAPPRGHIRGRRTWVEKMLERPVRRTSEQARRKGAERAPTERAEQMAPRKPVPPT